MYNHEHQYRCTIIRGKSQKEMDDLLPAYAKVIDEICPCSVDVFEQKFNNAFKQYLPVDQRVKKTLDNHRTEISGKLFGMYYASADGNVYESERTQKYLTDSDQPAFFKDICYKMQFPTGSQKIATTVAQRVADKISIRPNAFILKLLLLAHNAKVYLTKRNIGYYVLNSLDVLQGIATPDEVLATIIKDRANNIERDIPLGDKASSYVWQHINEQLNYLELANLIRITDEKQVLLNQNELETINLFANDWNKSPEFDFYSCDFSSVEDRKAIQLKWDMYFSQLSSCANQFATSAAALMIDVKPQDNSKPVKATNNLVEFGDEGEQIVYEYEKSRVSQFNPRLANKVLSLGKTKGLGYDIQSVVAEAGDMAEFVKYIEVKSTKRLTCPDLNDALWIDNLNITRNEWIAAMQHRDFYSIYRVYFTRDGISIFVIENPVQKSKENKITVTPMTYRMDFNYTAIDTQIQNIRKDVD